jgi:hypothetical protein
MRNLESGIGKAGQTGPGRFRAALLISLVAPLVEWVRFAAGQGNPFHPGETAFGDIVVVGGLPILAVAFAIFWANGFHVLNATFTVIRFLVGRRISHGAWEDRTWRAFWVLPWGASAGVALWLTYSLGGFGGWPSDVIFGALAHLIGACCYGNLLLAWYRLLRFPPDSRFPIPDSRFQIPDSRFQIPDSATGPR